MLSQAEEESAAPTAFQSSVPHPSNNHLSAGSFLAQPQEHPAPYDHQHAWGQAYGHQHASHAGAPLQLHHGTRPPFHPRSHGLRPIDAHHHQPRSHVASSGVQPLHYGLRGDPDSKPSAHQAPAPHSHHNDDAFNSHPHSHHHNDASAEHPHSYHHDNTHAPRALNVYNGPAATHTSSGVPPLLPHADMPHTHQQPDAYAVYHPGGAQPHQPYPQGPVPTTSTSQPAAPPSPIGGTVAHVQGPHAGTPYVDPATKLWWVWARNDVWWFDPHTSTWGRERPLPMSLPASGPQAPQYPPPPPGPPRFAQHGPRPPPPPTFTYSPNPYMPPPQAGISSGLSRFDTAEPSGHDIATGQPGGPAPVEHEEEEDLEAPCSPIRPEDSPLALIAENDTDFAEALGQLVQHVLTKRLTFGRVLDMFKTNEIKQFFGTSLYYGMSCKAFCDIIDAGAVLGVSYTSTLEHTLSTRASHLQNDLPKHLMFTGGHGTPGPREVGWQEAAGLHPAVKGPEHGAASAPRPLPEPVPVRR